MIIEINYTALQWDNYQGGSGKPISGRLLRNVDCNFTLAELKKFVKTEIDLESSKTKQIIGDYILVNAILDV